MALMASRPLQYTLLLLLTFFIAVAVGVLATRSIWIDEAMLLRNVYETDVPGFLHPLPYYDQASPFLASTVIKLISEIAGTNFVFFRILIFAFLLICAAPLLVKLKQRYGLNGLLVFVLVCAANVYNVLFYATEIKHYGFEAASVFLFLFWFFIYLEDPKEAFTLRRIWVALLAIAMGFSTLLIAPAFFLFVVIDFLFQYKNRQLLMSKPMLTKYAVGFALMALVTGIFYMWMSHLTVYQMNYQEYRSADYDIEKLYSSISEALGYTFMPVIALLLLSFFTPPQGIIFRFGLFFLSTLMIVVFLKLIGVYPVVSHRHVIWVAPISMTFLTVFAYILLSRRDRLGLFLVFLISLFVARDAVDVEQGRNGEITSNNALYAALETIPPADVLVFGHARPSLEIYKMKTPGLFKHRYFGLMANGDLSSETHPLDVAFAGAPLRREEFTDWQFRQLPQRHSFYVVISHTHPIEEEPPREHMIIPLRKTLDKNDCAYESIFQAKLTQILQVRCPHGSNGAPSPQGR